MIEIFEELEILRKKSLLKRKVQMLVIFIFEQKEKTQGTKHLT